VIRIAKISLFFALLAPMAGSLHAQQPNMPAILHEVRIEQRLNQQVPAGIVFRDENGNAVHIGDSFGKRAIVL